MDDLPAAYRLAACTALVIALDGGILVGYENHAGMLPVVRRILDAGYLPGDFGIEIRAHHHRVFAWIVAMLSNSGLGENGALAVLAVASYATSSAPCGRSGGSLGLSPERRTPLCFAMASGFALINHGVEANRMLGNGPIMPPTLAHAFALFSAAAMVNRRWNAAFAWAGAVALIHLQIGAIWLIVVLVTAGVYGVWRRPREWLPGCPAMLALSSPALFDLVALSRQGLAHGIRVAQRRQPAHAAALQLSGRPPGDGRCVSARALRAHMALVQARRCARGSVGAAGRDCGHDHGADAAPLRRLLPAPHRRAGARAAAARELDHPGAGNRVPDRGDPQAPPARAPRERLVLLSLAALMATVALANAFLQGRATEPECGGCVQGRHAMGGRLPLGARGRAGRAVCHATRPDRLHPPSRAVRRSSSSRSIRTAVPACRNGFSDWLQ